MGNIQINTPRFYRHIVAPILLLLFAIAIIYFLFFGENHEYVDKPNVNCNFNVEQVNDRYLYSGEVINNEEFDLSTLTVHFIDKNNNNRIVGQIEFKELKAGETRQFNDSFYSQVSDISQVGFDLGYAEKSK